jgi:hypothetical protein
MPDVGDAASGYADGVKWLVGISGAAIGGAFTQYEQTWHQPLWVRGLLALDVVLFVISIWAGVNYLLWINAVRRAKERISEIDSKRTALGEIASEEKKRELDNDEKTSNAKLTKASQQLPGWHKAYSYSFSVAVLIAAGILFIAIARPIPKPEAAESPQRFTIVLSAVHSTSHGRQAHTFLLDQKTGDLWQMSCDPQGNVVAFRRVSVLDANGRPEVHPQNSASPPNQKELAGGQSF